MSKKSIAEKIAELEQETNWFYSDDFKLDEAAAKYEEVIRHSKEVEQDLTELKNKIEVIEKDFTKE